MSLKEINVFTFGFKSFILFQTLVIPYTEQNSKDIKKKMNFNLYLYLNQVKIYYSFTRHNAWFNHNYEYH